jgi:uncharacterized protein (DUF2062 family)
MVKLVAVLLAAAGLVLTATRSRETIDQSWNRRMRKRAQKADRLERAVTRAWKDLRTI